MRFLLQQPQKLVSVACTPASTKSTAAAGAHSGAAEHECVLVVQTLGQFRDRYSRLMSTEERIAVAQRGSQQRWEMYVDIVSLLWRGTPRNPGRAEALNAHIRTFPS